MNMRTEKEEFMIYEPPHIEMVEVEIENGFAVSVNGVGVNGWSEGDIFTGEATE